MSHLSHLTQSLKAKIETLEDNSLVNQQRFLSQRYPIETGTINQHLYLHLYNSSDYTLDFSSGDKYQLWITYYTAEGNYFLARYPGSQTVINAPNSNVGKTEYLYRILLEDVHANAPETAVEYALFFRIVDATYGVNSLNQATAQVLEQQWTTLSA